MKNIIQTWGPILLIIGTLVFLGISMAGGWIWLLFVTSPWTVIIVSVLSAVSSTYIAYKAISKILKGK